MTPRPPSIPDLLTELSSQGVVLTIEGDQLRCRAPRGVLTPELCAVIAERKPDLLAALRDAAPTSNVATEPRRSARPLADAWAQTEQAAQHAIILDADRAALLDWALANGCPPLEIHPWATVVGTAHGWQKFVRWGSADDIAAALVAAGLHHPERLLAPEQT